MRDLDGVHSGLIKGLGDRPHLIQPVHMANGVHAIAQGHVLDVELLARLDVELAHQTDPPAAAIRRAAISSPVALAAAVMMSRLPE